MLLDARHSLLGDGPLTAVPAFRATSDERARALAPHRAQRALRDVCRAAAFGDRHDLVTLDGLVWGDRAVGAWSVRTEVFAERVLQAAGEGRLLLVPGWPGRGGRAGTAAPVDARAPEEALAARVMRRREEIAFESRRYVVLPAASWRGFEDRDRFQVVARADAATVLARMAERASGDEAIALTASIPMLAQTRSPHTEAGLFLIRRVPAAVSVSTAALAATPPALAMALPRIGPADLLFEFLSNTGHPIADDTGYELVGPGGVVEPGWLSNGRLQRLGVDPGTYELRVRALRSARWSTTAAHPFDQVSLHVESTGFPDGTDVQIEVWPAQGPPDAPPLLALSGHVMAGRATVSWRYQQALGAPPCERLQFAASIGKKHAWSDILEIGPHAADTPLGAQERLRALGYDPGPPSHTLERPLAAALRAYQADHPPLVSTGKLDEWTAAHLDEELT